MPKKQVSKQSRPIHKRPARLNPKRLQRSLQRDWRQNHIASANVVPLGTLEHINRAKEVSLPADVEADSLTARALELYFNTRSEMSDLRIKELGAKSAAAATDKIVFDSFIPDQEEADFEDIIAVASGIRLAKVALNRKLLTS